MKNFISKFLTYIRTVEFKKENIGTERVMYIYTLRGELSVFVVVVDQLLFYCLFIIHKLLKNNIYFNFY
jgi:hypothetical protein